MMNVDNQGSKTSEIIELEKCQTDIILNYNKYRPWANSLFARIHIRMDAADILNSYYQFQAFYLSLHCQSIETITVWDHFRTWSRAIAMRKMHCPNFFVLDYAENPDHVRLILEAAVALAGQPRYKEEIISDLRDMVHPGNRRDMLSEYFLISMDGKFVDAIYALNHTEAERILAERYRLNYPLNPHEFINHGFRSFIVVLDEKNFSRLFPK